MSLSTNTVLRTAFETFRVQELVGEGGAGIVYRVKDSEDKAFAVKVLDGAKATPQKSKRFKNELNFCIRHHHRNLIRVLDHGLTSDNAPFYVMPFYAETLRSLMRPVPAQDVLPMFTQILDGVEAAHLLGACHRDLKPENVLFNRSENLLVVADFGIASFRQEDLYTAVETRSQERLANFQYAAPEQKERGRNVDQRADIFALGLVLNELYTNSVPQGTGFRQIGQVAENFAYLDVLVDNMLQNDPDRRPQSVASVKAELLSRGNTFLSFQKLKALEKEVVKETQIDDPLVSNPVALVGFDWDDNQLKLVLNTTPNQIWIDHFRILSNFRYITRICAPQLFKFQGVEARIVARERFVQQIIDLFKTYLKSANEAYKSWVFAEEEKRVRERAEKHRATIENEKVRQRILDEIKI